MPAAKTYWWTEAPFLRLLPPLMLGIVAGWYLQLSSFFLLVIAGASLFIFLLLLRLPLSLQFRLRTLPGFCLLLLLAAIGGLLAGQADMRRQQSWMGHQDLAGSAAVAVLEEVPVVKPNSLKAVARITHLINEGKLHAVTGKAILYFQKTAAVGHLAYGNRLLLLQPLQPVQNSGNPGAFDYQRYCLFQGITHQVFLSDKAYRILPGNGGDTYHYLLISSRQAIVEVLRRYITQPRERGLAEALLIGYKDELDKGLVQAYSNTGVVHVIAISGLHLGLIYGIMLLLTRPLRHRSRWLRCLLVVAGLWAFSLLAGGQPSVMRSAVMFSCMALAELIDRKASLLNTLALSAFALLCYNPYWLWDLGFQLSYAAVASILIFYQPLYHLLYFPNKVIDGVWKLVALTLTAQILTLPISLFHFHQFPVLFLVTNLLAVPVSSIILTGEILLCVLAFLPPVAERIGQVLEVLMQWLNIYILRLNELSFAVWDGFSLSTMQVVLLYISIAGVGAWLLASSKAGLRFALVALLGFVVLRTASFLQANRQRQLIVYHVPRHRAVDLVSGRQVYFAGDTALLQESFERNFHLRPARVLFRAASVLPIACKAFAFGGKNIVFVNKKILLPDAADVLIVSGKNAAVIQVLPAYAKQKQVVLDATVPMSQVRRWQKLCDALGWSLHDVRAKGAFVMKW